MTLEDPELDLSAIIVEVTNPETPFGGVQVFGAVDAPIQVILREGETGPPGEQGEQGEQGEPGEPGLDGPAGGVSQQGITPLVEGQSFVDVVFGSVQENASWHLVESAVVNTTDPTPLNLWTGVVTAKTASGFRIQLNGMPDTGNYYLSWGISGVSIPPTPATTYSLSGPTSGSPGVASPVFTVALLPSTTVDSPVTVTPDDGGGGGTFTPPSVMLTTEAPSGVFTYTPASTGTKTIGVTNDGLLTDPADISFLSSSYSTAYSFLGPGAGYINAASTNFTVALTGSGTLPAPVTVTPSDGGAGGVFTPSSVILSTASPSQTFIYTPSSYGIRVLSVTNSGGLTNPANRNYYSYASTYTLTGPSSGSVGVPSTNFTVALPTGGEVAALVTVTPHDGGAGGTFTPATVGLTTAAPSATFTYTPVSSGAKTISVTNDKAMTNPSNLTYTVASLVALLNTLVSYWKLDEASGTRNDTHGTNHLVDNNTVASTTGKLNNAANFVAANSEYLSRANNASLQVTGDFTFSCWVKMATLSNDQYLISKFGTTPATSGDYAIFYNASVGWIFSVNDALTIAVAHGTPVSAGVWYHLVAWWDSADNKLRIKLNDGATQVSTMTGALVQTSSPFQIGARPDGIPGVFLNGDVDEVGFWKRKLTALEITTLYGGGTPPPYSSFTT